MVNHYYEMLRGSENLEHGTGNDPFHAFNRNAPNGYSMSTHSDFNFLQLNPRGGALSSDWKFHLSVDPQDVPRAWDIVAEELMLDGQHTAKVVKPDTAQRFSNPDNIQAGKMITIYPNNNYSPEHYKELMERIEKKLDAAGIKAGPSTNADRAVPGSRYASYRRETDPNGNRMSSSDLDHLPTDQRWNPHNSPDPYKDFSLKSNFKSESAPADVHVSQVQDKPAALRSHEDAILQIDTPAKAATVDAPKDVLVSNVVDKPAASGVDVNAMKSAFDNPDIGEIHYSSTTGHVIMEVPADFSRTEISALGVDYDAIDRNVGPLGEVVLSFPAEQLDPEYRASASVNSVNPVASANKPATSSVNAEAIKGTLAQTFIPQATVDGMKIEVHEGRVSLTTPGDFSRNNLTAIGVDFADITRTIDVDGNVVLSFEANQLDPQYRANSPTTGFSNQITNGPSSPDNTVSGLSDSGKILHEGVEFEVFDPNKVSFDGAAEGRKSSETFVMEAKGGEEIVTKNADGKTESIYTAKKGEAIFVNLHNSDDIYIPGDEDGNRWKFSELEGKGYEIVKQSDGGDGVLVKSSASSKLLHEAVDRPTVILNAWGEGQHQFLYEGATLKLNDNGQVTGIDKDAFDNTWEVNKPAGAVRANNADISAKANDVTNAPADVHVSQVQAKPATNTSDTPPTNPLEVSGKDVLAKAEMEVPKAGGFWKKLGQRSGLIGGVVIGGAIGGYALANGASAAEAGEAAVEVAVPYGETGFDLARGDTEAAKRSATIETVSNVASIGGGMAGAAGGDFVGAAFGSVVPVIGTAIGFAAGGVIGFFAGGVAGGVAGGYATEKVIDNVNFSESGVMEDISNISASDVFNHIVNPISSTLSIGNYILEKTGLKETFNKSRDAVSNVINDPENALSMPSASEVANDIGSIADMSASELFFAAVNPMGTIGGYVLEKTGLTNVFSKSAMAVTDVVIGPEENNLAVATSNDMRAAIRKANEAINTNDLRASLGRVDVSDMSPEIQSLAAVSGNAEMFEKLLHDTIANGSYEHIAYNMPEVAARHAAFLVADRDPVEPNPLRQSSLQHDSVSNQTMTI